VKDNSKKRILIVSAIAIVVVILVVAAIVVNGSGSKNNLRDQLDLAEQYLSDLDYEQAIAAYEQALEIEPKCEEAYLGLADIYVTLEDYDNALEILNEGYEQTGAESIAEKIQEIQDMLADQENASENESEEVTEEETEQDTMTQQDTDSDAIDIDYTFDITTMDVTIYGKKIYEWIPDELMQYIYDTGIYDKSAEICTDADEEEGFSQYCYSVENVGYDTERVVQTFGEDVSEWVTLTYNNYWLYVDNDYNSIGVGKENGTTGSNADIQDNIMGKSLYEFLGNEEVVNEVTSIDGRLTCKNAEMYLNSFSDGLNDAELHIEINGGAVEFEVGYENGVITNVTMWNWN
jgi:hypothetical protein